MQSQTVRCVSFPDSYTGFRTLCAKVFECELSNYGREFKVYRLPPGVASIESRMLINEESYAQLCEDFRNPVLVKPSICIWSEREDSDSPNQRNYEDYLSCESASQRGSTSVSERVMTQYKFRCQACRHDYTNAKQDLNGCHIVELEELQGQSIDDIEDLLEECRLDTIDDPQNLIPLCSTCHYYFDLQKLGIDQKDDKFLWLVKPEQEKIQLPHSDQLYETIKGTEIKPPHSIRFQYASIAHRRYRYDHDISSKKKGVKRKVGKGAKVEYIII